MVTPVNGSTQSVTISCTGAPALATCNAASPSVTLNGSSASSLMINVTTTAGAAMLPRGPSQFPSFRVWILVTAGMLGSLALFLFARISRRTGYAFIGLSLMILAATIVGCGKQTVNVPGTPAGSYTLTLTATSGTGSSAQAHSTTVTLVVN